MTHSDPSSTVAGPPTLPTLLDAFPREFIDISPREQALAITLYRLLARGEPVTPRQLAQASGVAQDEVDALLAEWLGVYRDGQGGVVGFWGLALDETPHRLSMGGRDLYAWCAWDTLFLPALLGRTLAVRSRCPVTGEAIHLQVGTGGLHSVEPGQVVMSFVLPEAEGFRQDVVSSFCCAVLFFASPQAGRQWLGEHPWSFLMTLDEAFELAQMKNRRKYPALFASERS